MIMEIWPLEGPNLHDHHHSEPTRRGDHDFGSLQHHECRDHVEKGEED
jgi:hypothetical protein